MNNNNNNKTPAADQTAKSVGQVDDESNNTAKHAGQVLHTVRITIENAEFYRDPNEFVEQRFLLKNMNDLDRTKRVQEVTRNMESYVKIYFGTDKERASTFIHKGYLKKNPNRHIRQHSTKVDHIAFSSTFRRPTVAETTRGAESTINDTKSKATSHKHKQNANNTANNNAGQESSVGEGGSGGEEEEEEDEDEGEGEEYFNIGSTFISEDHLKPAWNETLQFSRTTETYFTVVVFESDTMADYHQRYKWLKDKYHGDVPIGEAKVEITRFVRKQKDGRQAKTVKLYRGEEEIGIINLVIEYFDAVRPKFDDRFSKLELSFYGFVALFEIDLSKFTEQKMRPYLLCKLLGMKRKTSYGDIAAKSIQYSDKLNFRLDEEDAIDRKVSFSVIMINEETKYQEVIGVSVLELNSLKVGDNRIDRPLFMSYKGKFSGTLFLEYVKTPAVLKQPKKSEFRDMKEISKPSEEEAKKKELVEQKKELMSQKFYGFNMPVKTKNLTIPDVKDLIHFEKVKVTLEPVTTKSGVQAPVLKEIEVRRVNDYNYRHQILGSGLTKWGSSQTLTHSVPSFSIPKDPRFSVPSHIKVSLPPNLYGNLGLPPEQDILDKKLAEIRKHNYEDFIQSKKFTDPVGNQDFWDIKGKKGGAPGNQQQQQQGQQQQGQGQQGQQGQQQGQQQQQQQGAGVKK